MADHPRDKDPDIPGEAAARNKAAQEAEALRDERQTERQAPDNASPGEAAGG